jgi:hypothetical protein
MSEIFYVKNLANWGKIPEAVPSTETVNSLGYLWLR